MSKLGRYEVVRELGRGGFGRVLLGRDPVMGRPVAIKVLHTGDDPDLLARFRKEAAAAGNLKHPNIVTIFDYGEENGSPYLVMEYIEGEELRGLLDRGVPLTLLEKARILMQAAEGLHYAHQRGLVHRDIKPGNIMILKDGTAKVLDFGIARAVGDATTRVTKTGLLIGTLKYMAPELFEGTAADVLTDEWAFGVLAFELLGGYNPFEAQDTAQIIYRITKTAPAPLQMSVPGLSPQLAGVVTRMLQRDRRNRYPSFEDIVLDLEPVISEAGRFESERIVAQAKATASKGDLEGAQQLLRRALAVDPTNQSARRFREEIQALLARDVGRRHALELIERGDSEMASRNYPAALEYFQQALAADATNSSAQVRLDQARQILERVETERRVINTALEEWRRGELAAARERLKHLVAAGALGDEAPGLLRRVEEEIQRQEESRAAETVWQARMKYEQGDPEGALAMLESLTVVIPAAEELRLEIRGAGERSRQIPAQREEKAANEARLLALEGKWEEAEAILSAALADNPASTALREAQAEVRAGRAKIEEEEASRRALRELLARVRKAREMGQLEEARDGIHEGLKRFPEAKELTAEREALRRAFNDHLEKQRIQEALEAVESQLAAGAPAEAQRLLDEALAAHPGNISLDVLRSRVALARRKAARPASETSVPLEEEEPAAVVEPALPEPGLFASVSPEPRKSRTLLYGGIGAGVVAVAAISIWLATRDTTPPASPPVAPTTAGQPRVEAPKPAPARPEPEAAAAPSGAVPAKPEPAMFEAPPGPLRFSWARGQALPAAQPVMLRVSPAGARVEVNPNMHWLSARQVGGSLEVSVNPSALAAGDHLASLRLRASGIERTMRVVLTVQYPDRAGAPLPVLTAPVKAPEPAPAKPAPKETKETAAQPAVSAPVETWAGGAKQGVVRWFGELAPGVRLVLGNNRILEGPGMAQNLNLPPNLTIVRTDPPGLQTQIGPAPNTRRITIVNNAGQPLQRIEIQWRLKE